MSVAYIPYCGNPPVPGHLLWNLDPVLFGGLAGLAALYAWSRVRGSYRGSRAETAFFAVGWLLLGLALMTPLCNLSVALFSARVAQHMIITLIAAPLIVLGRPERALAGLFFVSPRKLSCGPLERLLAPLAFAAALWLWHMPAPYDATLRSDEIYWTMHVSLFATAFLLWRVLLGDLHRHLMGAIVASLFTGFQMSVLGAVLALASRPFFTVHFGTTFPWGLSPLEDQQLGGLIMWVPGGFAVTVHILAALGFGMGRLERQPASLSFPT